MTDYYAGSFIKNDTLPTNKKMLIVSEDDLLCIYTALLETDDERVTPRLIDYVKTVIVHGRTV